MSKILDNPKEFFESLSTQEFEDLLNEFGFEYEDISDNSIYIKNIKKYTENIKINMFMSFKSDVISKNYTTFDKEIKFTFNNALKVQANELYKSKKEELLYKEDISINFEDDKNNLKAA